MELTGLRDYQLELLDQATDSLIPSSARVMLQLPTGGGKTHIAGALLRDWLRDGRKAVWLTHRTELAEQTRQMLTDAGVSAINPAWRTGSDAPFIANGTVILMAQTVGRRTNRMHIWGQYKAVDLLLIDEAHHATADGWERAINQWPGRVVGLTATPWRLSTAEGFDHLFKKLVHGPQVSELQDAGWLCQARVLVPRPEEVIRGGSINTTGEYSESGIEEANQDRPNVMTAGALRFWQAHAVGRQTVVYAVSQEHARKLALVFREAGIPASVMLSDTPPEERAKAIESFANGTLRVLVNVAVATEGFDLPDASCVVITRPTMSLALYLQMVGRGLRPKANGGDCLILDLAGNAEIHGLPEDKRTWFLSPRGNNPGSEPPVIRCEKCDSVSPASNHSCVFCQTPFGKDCPRCGVWRAWQRWRYETHCSELHELVCDLCHYDAHIQAQLPVTGELRRLSEMEPDLDTVLRNLLEEERRIASSANEERKNELHSFITTRESELADDDGLGASFDQYIATLPLLGRPRRNSPQIYRIYGEWEAGLKQELAGWKDELSELEKKVPDGRLIYNNVRGRVLESLEAQAREARLLAQAVPRQEVRQRQRQRQPIAENSVLVLADMSGWQSFVKLGEWGNIDPTGGSTVKPKSFRGPKGNVMPVKSWPDLLFQTAEWLVREGLIVKDLCPIRIGSKGNRYLINTVPVNAKGTNFHGAKELSNGLYIECNASGKDAARVCRQLLTEFGKDPSQFHVQLG